MTNTKGNKTSRGQHFQWRVIGDHPIGRRPDKTFTGPDAETFAKQYVEELKKAGYENIRCECLPFTEKDL